MMKAEDVAKIMSVSVRSVYRYAERYLATGDVKPFVKRNGPRTELCEFEELFLVQLALANPGIYLRELQEHLYSKTMHWVDAATICRTIHRVGMTRQKIKHYSLGRSEARRAEFLEEISYFDPSMIVWVDETGCDLRNARENMVMALEG